MFMAWLFLFVVYQKLPIKQGGEIVLDVDGYDRNVWNILHRLHDYDLEDVERDLICLERIISETKVHNIHNWRTRLRTILMRIRSNKMEDDRVMKEYDKILRSLEPYEYIIVSRAIVRLMGNRTRELLENPELYQRLRKGYQKDKESKKK